MKILFLTQWFDPEPTPKGLAFARALVNAGHDVEVLTGFPNYPSGKVYPGYRVKWIQKEIIDGVKITRVPLYPNHDNSALKRIINYLSFCFSSCFYGVFFMKKPDVIYIYHPPMTVGLSGAIIGLLRRVPFVYDVQDIWPDTLPATGMLNNTKILRVIGHMCQWIYKRATKIVVISPGFKKLLIERGVTQNKIEIIYNWADEDLLRNPVFIDLKNTFNEQKFNVVFAGNMGKAQALDTLINAAQHIETCNSNIQFILVGGGVEVEHLKKMTENKKINNVIFLPHMPMNQIGTVLALADVLIVHLKNDPLFEITIPSKTQAYLSVGKPIIMGVKGDAAHLIKESGAGYCVEPENIISLVEAILNIASKNSAELLVMSKAALTFYSQNLAFNIGIEKTLDTLKAVYLRKIKN